MKDRVAGRPALEKADQQAQRDLKRQYRRQHRPREVKRVACGDEKKSPYYFWREATHAQNLRSNRQAVLALVRMSPQLRGTTALQISVQVMCESRCPA
jgi:hypothetical protein